MTSLVKPLANIKITQNMFDKLDYDSGSRDKTITTTTGTKPLGIFVFTQSDLNAAAYHLTQSMQDPLHPGAIKCAFVQESCADKFKELLNSQMKPYSKEARGNKALTDALSKASDVLTQLQPKLFKKCENPPVVVFEFPQEHFTADGPSPVVTFYTFRTVKEAIALSKKENIVQAASIWCENHATGYEVIAGTSLSHYYLNCCNVEWSPIAEYIASKQTFVAIENSYHYETLVTSGVQKSVVFPFGTTFAN